MGTNRHGWDGWYIVLYHFLRCKSIPRLFLGHSPTIRGKINQHRILHRIFKFILRNVSMYLIIIQSNLSLYFVLNLSRNFLHPICLLLHIIWLYFEHVRFLNHIKDFFRNTRHIISLENTLVSHLEQTQ